MIDAALLFPPGWYSSAVPVELSVPLGFLRERGVNAIGVDLNAAWLWTLFHGQPAWKTLRDPAAYGPHQRLFRAAGELGAHADMVSARTSVDVAFRHLRPRGVDPGDVVALGRLGNDPARNPLLQLLVGAVNQVLDRRPRVVGLAVSHPEQRLAIVTLAGLLRGRGFQGRLVLFGGLSDQLSPLDLAEDLAGDPPHRLFAHVDAALLGDAGQGLLDALDEATWSRPFPDRLRAGESFVEPTAGPIVHRPDFGFVEPLHTPYPTPLVDLRLTRGCPWARCTFCAIQAHHPSFGIGALADLGDAVDRAHATLGARFFRLRDDLLTPTQLVEVGRLLATRPFRPRWCARARFQASLTEAVLREARAGGLDELWLGLESGSERLREQMDKGVDDATVERVLDAAAAAGVRVRLLCISGHPGETAEDVEATFALLHRRTEVVSASMTPFLAVRRAPIARDLARHGLARDLDALPRSVRLRHTVFLRDDHERRARAEAVLARFTAELSPRMARQAVPDLAHGWRRDVSDEAAREA